MAYRSRRSERSWRVLHGSTDRDGEVTGRGTSVQSLTETGRALAALRNLPLTFGDERRKLPVPVRPLSAAVPPIRSYCSSCREPRCRKTDLGAHAGNCGAVSVIGCHSACSATNVCALPRFVKGVSRLPSRIRNTSGLERR
jgi:hypothetical protein